MKNLKRYFIGCMVCITIFAKSQNSPIRKDFNYIKLYDDSQDSWLGPYLKKNTFILNYNSHGDIKCYFENISYPLFFRQIAKPERKISDKGNYCTILSLIDERGDHYKIFLFDDGGFMFYINQIDTYVFMYKNYPN